MKVWESAELEELNISDTSWGHGWGHGGWGHGDGGWGHGGCGGNNGWNKDDHGGCGGGYSDDQS